MKAAVYDTQGKKISQIELPVQFEEPYHPDLIKRAVLAIRANKRQPYGAAPRAGKRHSVRISKRRRDYKGSYGHGISRAPKKTMWRRGTQFGWEGAFAPGTKGGRKAHPPKAEKDFSVKININEKRKAIRSALSATLNRELVETRGHKLGEIYPIILESKAELLEKTKDVKKLLSSFKLEKELERNKKKKIRAGKGKLRGRKYTRKRGMLMVISSKCKLSSSAQNIPGVEVTEVRNLNTELLAPGTHAGRLTIYTDKAIEEIKSKALFTNKEKKFKKPKTRTTKEKPKTKEPEEKKAKENTGNPQARQSRAQRAESPLPQSEVPGRLKTPSRGRRFASKESKK
ncbi:MAG: 50S ribosomal protein L4 [Nanoarchaeota archaeon]|nr:50S ribosomal protein L4 [Nanoarchaeota archaeon]